MKTVADMQEYIRSRTNAELEVEFETYKTLWRNGHTDVFIELLAIEIDSRKANGDE
jgi:hypothetical protein